MLVLFMSDEEERLFRFWRPPVQRLHVEVHFDEEETYHIDRYQLLDYAVVERKPTIKAVEEEIEKGGELATRTVKEKVDNNIYLREFFSRAATFELPNPAALRALTRQLMEGFERTQHYLTENGCSEQEVEFYGN